MTRTKTILTTLAAATVAATASLAYAQDTGIAKHACTEVSERMHAYAGD